MTDKSVIRTNELLAKLGLSHSNVDMYFTEVQFFQDGPKTFEDFLEGLLACWEKMVAQHKDWRGNLLIDRVGITFGHADAMIAWEAKDSQWAKIFRREVLGCMGHRSVSVTCIANEGGKI